MKVLVWQGKKKISMEERIKPEPSRGDVLVKVAYVGICGTDMGIYKEEGNCDFGFKPPRILGHEISGIIDQVGAGVEEVKAGDRITINPVFNCEKCYACRAGNPHLCTGGVELLGEHRDGGLAEYIALPVKKVFRLPEAVTLKEGCLMEPLACVITAYEMLKIGSADNMVILGCGLAGLLFVQLAKATGIKRVFMSGTRQERLKIGQRLGADRIILVKEQNLIEEIREAVKDKGIDIVVEAAGVPETIRQAIEIVRKGGQILIYGAPTELVNGLDFRNINLKGITIYGGVGPGNKFEEAIQLVSSRKIRFNEIITHEFNIDNAQEAFEAVLKRKDGLIKAIIKVAGTDEDEK